MKFTKILLLTALLGTTSLMAEATNTETKAQHNKSYCLDKCKERKKDCTKTDCKVKEKKKVRNSGKFCTEKCECGGNKKK